MTTLLTFVQVEFKLILIFLALIIAYKIITQRINTAGLLSDKETGKFSPARFQLLIFTLIGAGTYISVAGVAEPVDVLKHPDNIIVGLVGGSNVYYIGAKGLSRINEHWFKNFKNLLQR